MIPSFFFLFLIIICAVFLFWLTQLLLLMDMNDDDFPGRYDKLIWAAFLLVLFALGALLFVIWKWKVRRVYRRSESIAEQKSELASFRERVKQQMSGRSTDVV